MQAHTLSDEKMRRVMADPPLVWRVVEPDEPHFYLQEIGYVERPGFLARLLGRKAEPPPLPDLGLDSREGRNVYLEKSWDGLNFCLKRLIAPGSCRNLFEDGVSVGKVEIGYGPAMWLSSEEVAQIARCYRPLTGDDLLAKFAPDEMGDVYPGGLWRAGDRDVTSYIVENFDDLKSFVEQAAHDGVGIVVVYT